MIQTTRLGATHDAPDTGSLLLQRKCACGAEASTLTDRCEECGKTQMLGLQTKLTVSEPGDRYEQEADRVADEVMRMPAPNIRRQAAPEEDEKDEKDEPLQLKALESGASLQRQATEEEDEEEEQIQAKELPGKTPVVTSTVSKRIDAMRGTGSPLPESARAFYEPRFGVDFGKTRVHTSTLAADTARSINARAFTLGRDIFFNAGELQPDTVDGKRLLAHELTHVVQQAGSPGRLSPSRREGALRSTAPAINDASSSSPSRAISNARPALMRLSPERFQKRLGRTTEQRTVIDALFNHPTFRKLWDWIGKCEGKRADHGPIKLRVGRTYSDDAQTVGAGVQTFGEFNQTHGILKINPRFREAGKRVARENPQELVDTVVHELVHAVSWALRTGKCPGQQEPLPQTEKLVDDKSRRLFEPEHEGVKTTDRDRVSLDKELARFERLGPSASDPCRYFLDIEAAPQEEIVDITDDIRQDTDIGGPTRTRVNQILRDEIRRAKPAARAEDILAAAPLLRGFMRCRDEECSKRRRKRNIARCFDQVLAGVDHASKHGETDQTAGTSTDEAPLRRTETQPQRLQPLATPTIQRATNTTDEGQGGELDRADRRLVDWASRKMKRDAVKRWVRRLEKGQLVAFKRWRQKRVRRVLELASPTSTLAEELGNTFIEQLKEFVQLAEKKQPIDSAEAASKSTEAEPGTDADVIQVSTLIKGAAVENPDSLEWSHFKSTAKKPKLGKKKVIAASDIKPRFLEGRFVADFKGTSAVWSHVEPFDKQAHWIGPTCQPMLTRCNAAVDKLGPDLSLVTKFPNGFEWSADLICADKESGTKDREVKSTSDCEALFKACSKANPIALKGPLLRHERGHLWIYALASARANEHLAAGEPQPAVASKLSSIIDSLVESYELETNHACPTLGTTRFWNGSTVRKQVDAAWPKPEQDG